MAKKKNKAVNCNRNSSSTLNLWYIFIFCLRPSFWGLASLCVLKHCNTFKNTFKVLSNIYSSAYFCQKIFTLQHKKSLQKNASFFGLETFVWRESLAAVVDFFFFFAFFHVYERIQCNSYLAVKWNRYLEIKSRNSYLWKAASYLFLHKRATSLWKGPKGLYPAESFS